MELIRIIKKEADIGALPEGAEILYLPGSSLVQLNPTKHCKVLYVQNNCVNYQDFSEFYNLVNLNLCNNTITSLKFIRFPQQLMYLDLSKNNIYRIEVGHLTYLKVLSLNYCKFALFENLQLPKSLQFLFLQHNNLETVEIPAHLVKLVLLDLRYNVVRRVEPYDARVRILLTGNYV